MPEIKMGHTFKPYSIVSITSEDANYPASELSGYGNVRRHWRSTDTVEQIIVLDLFSGFKIPCIFLDHCNFASCTIEVNAANDWSGPEDSQAVTVNEDDFVERYKIWHEPESVSDRYVRIIIPNQTPTDGENYFRISRIIIPGIVFTPDHNIAWGYPAGANIPKRRNEFMSGGHETAWLGSDLVWQGEITWGYYPTDSLGNMRTLNARLENDLALFYENIETDTSKAYCVEKMNEININRAGYNQNNVTTLTLREKL